MKELFNKIHANTCLPLIGSKNFLCTDIDIAEDITKTCRILTKELFGENIRVLIKKKSGKKFPPPFDNDGKTAIAVGTKINKLDPKHRLAFVLENGSLVNIEMCKVIKDLNDEEI